MKSVMVEFTCNAGLADIGVSGIEFLEGESSELSMDWS
jgi:hypothetical protein